MGSSNFKRQERVMLSKAGNSFKNKLKNSKNKKQYIHNFLDSQWGRNRKYTHKKSDSAGRKHISKLIDASNKDKFHNFKKSYPWHAKGSADKEVGKHDAFAYHQPKQLSLRKNKKGMYESKLILEFIHRRLSGAAKRYKDKTREKQATMVDILNKASPGFAKKASNMLNRDLTQHKSLNVPQSEKRRKARSDIRDKDKHAGYNAMGNLNKMIARAKKRVGGPHNG